MTNLKNKWIIKEKVILSYLINLVLHFCRLILVHDLD